MYFIIFTPLDSGRPYIYREGRKVKTFKDSYEAVVYAQRYVDTSEYPLAYDVQYSSKYKEKVNA